MFQPRAQCSFFLLMTMTLIRRALNLKLYYQTGILSSLDRFGGPVKTYLYSSVKYFGSEMGKSALVLIVEGTEEMEFTISADVLRRAGVSVTVAGVEGKDPVKCSRDVVIVPDTSLAEAVKKGPYDAVVLPGGAGYKKFAASAEVGSLLKEQEKSGGIVAAICAAPSVLKTHGIATGKSLTSYPSVKDELVKDYKYSEDKVVIDGKLITSRGPGTAFDFALALAEHLTDKANADKVKAGLLL